MFYISLPFFYKNYDFNNFFRNYIQENKDKIIDNFSIEYCYGSFPWSLWNGDTNAHFGKAVLNPEMELIFNSVKNPIRIDWSSCLLTEKDYFDVHENATLKLLSNTGNVCEISDMGLMQYVSNFDKNIRFIISNNSQIFYPFSENIINTFTEQESVELVSINNIQDFDTKQLNKKKIEIIIDECNCNNNQLMKCCQKEQFNIYNFSGNSVFFKCPKSKIINNYYQEILPLYRLGFTHFKIKPNLMLGLEDFNLKIITSFIKPEYVGDCLIEYYKSKK